MESRELFPLNAERPEPKNLANVLAQYTRYWYLLVIGAALGLGAAFVYLKYYAVPQYSVFSTLLIKDNKSGQGLSNADALNDLSSFKATTNIDTEIEVLDSKGLMERVVNELGLFTSYHLPGRLKNREIYGSQLPIKVLLNKLDSTARGKSFTINLEQGNRFRLEDSQGRIKAYSFGQQISHPAYGVFTVVATASKQNVHGRIVVNIQDMQQVAAGYNQAIQIRQVNKNANVLRLSLTDISPERAKNILNKLMEVYNHEAVDDKNIMAANTLKFLDERLAFITTQLSGVEKVVENYKSANGVADIGTQATGYIGQASNYDKQLSEWAIQIDVLESIENYLRKPETQSATVPSSLGIQDETLLGLIGKFNELQLERERMLRTLQPTNPLITNVNEQVANLRANILENLRNIKAGLRITSNNLRSSSRQFQTKIKRVPGMERELLEITRNQSIKQNIYVYLLQKREETALALAATASAARVIDPAMGGEYPISPNRQIIYLMSLLLGMGVPLAGIFLKNLLNDKVQVKEDVTITVAAPIIGEIAHNDENQTVVVTSGNRSAIAEMYRLVRANLHFASLGREKLTVLVTSSMSGEGKTFFSINLSASLVITGKRVVLVDLDMRKPKVAHELDLPRRPGIADYLVADDLTVDDIILTTEKVPGLSVIEPGTEPPNPAELMMTPKFAHLMHELKERFDYVIIDSAPVGQVADAFALNSFVDFTIFMVRYNYTRKAQLAIAKSIYDNKTLKSPLIVLNDAKKINGNNYGYGYGYGQPKEKRKKVFS